MHKYGILISKISNSNLAEEDKEELSNILLSLLTKDMGIVDENIKVLVPHLVNILNGTFNDVDVYTPHTIYRATSILRSFSRKDQFYKEHIYESFYGMLSQRCPYMKATSIKDVAEQALDYDFIHSWVYRCKDFLRSN